jgi:choline dehydrogenase-like flavoprotein
VALELGPELSLADFDDDELRNVIRDQVFSRDQLETFRPDAQARAETGRFSQIAHCVGGTLTHWAAWSWRFRPDEFKVLSTEGPVAGASLADWPIDYDELEPFYEKAEWDFGVSGTAGANPFAAPRAGKTHEVRAQHVVVSAGTIGTPHLLLLSSSSAFPHGLANGSGLVGRNFEGGHTPEQVTGAAKVKTIWGGEQ